MASMAPSLASVRRPRPGAVWAGAEPVVSSSAYFAAQVKEESARLGALVQRYPME